MEKSKILRLAGGLHSGPCPIDEPSSERTGEEMEERRASKGRFCHDLNVAISSPNLACVMSLLTFLSPAPHIPPLENPQEIKTQYRHWRWRIFLGIYVGYVLYYFSRKSITFAIPMLLEAGYTKSDVGLLGSILAITYGMSKFFGGVLGDRSNPRYFMAIGLMLTGLMNILFGLSSMVIFFSLFCNGYEYGGRILENF